MLVYTREVLLSRLLLVPDLVSLYQAQDGGFLSGVLQWMGTTEDALKRLRHPLASLCSSQRAKVLAAMDGVLEGGAGAAGGNTRKASRAAAALCLSHVEGALRQRVNEVDAQLHTASEKMSQLLALGSAQKPLPLPPTEPHNQWVQQVWLQLGSAPETRNLHGYLAALLTSADRVAVLSDALGNLLDALPPPP